MLAPIQSGRVIKPKRRPFRLDLGCGDKKMKGYVGIDRLQLKGVDHLVDLTEPWPFRNGDVNEVHSSHFIEHLIPQERCHFFNELWRVLAPDGHATIIVPHWSSCRAYGDPTHAWPPMGEFFWYYLDKEWRMFHAPHTDIKHLPWGYDCNFESTWGYGLSPTILPRSQDYQTYAVNHLREAVYDIHATLKRKA